jgi:hypothetical protein
MLRFFCLPAVVFHSNIVVSLTFTLLALGSAFNSKASAVFTVGTEGQTVKIISNFYSLI